MIKLFNFLYALSSVFAAGSLVWGIGSAMMNGIRSSNLSICLIITIVCAVIAGIMYYLSTMYFLLGAS